MEDNGGHCREEFDINANGGYAPAVSQQSYAQLTTPAPIIQTATPPSLIKPLTKQISLLDKAFRDSGALLSNEELDAMERTAFEQKKALESVELKIRGERIRRQMSMFDGMIGTLTDDDAPGFGKRFVERAHSANMGFDVAYEGLTSIAVYTAYSLAVANRGRPNMMRFHPNALTNLYDLLLFSTHERGHGIQNEDVEALKYSPFNPASLAVVHPSQWIELELDCERDTIVPTALIASKMEEFIPGLRQYSIDAGSILNVEEFEKIRELHPNLMDAVVAASIKCLTKHKDDAKTITYEDGYVDTALSHISAGLYWRREFNLGDVTFVRLTEENFREIGRHGILPNTMGENFMEPLLRREPRMNEANRLRYESLSREYNFPALADCPTIQEYKSQTASPENNGMNGGWAPISSAVHTPSVM